MKILSRLFGVLSWFIYAAIIGALLIAAPILLGYRPVVVLSGSMEPAFPVGSIIYYKQAGFDQIHPGDAITFTIGEDSLASHRVKEKKEAEQVFITKGDNNPSEDAEPVAFENVVGKVATMVIPYAGFCTPYLRNWYVLLVLGVILLMNIVLSPEDTDKKKAKEQKEAEG